MTDEILEDLLTDCTVERLCGLAREFGLKGYSRLDKGGLVSLLLEKGDTASLRERLLAPVSPAPVVEEIEEIKEKKEKRLSKITSWVSILGVGVGVTALVVILILSSSSDKHLTDTERKIKELEKAVGELCVGTPQERQEALAEIKKGNMEKTRELLKKVITAQCGVLPEDNYQLARLYEIAFIFKKMRPQIWQ